ncbi:MAG: Arylesterase precursor, partial [uncultured Acetobacteraceae bacterium]
GIHGAEEIPTNGVESRQRMSCRGRAKQWPARDSGRRAGRLRRAGARASRADPPPRPGRQPHRRLRPARRPGLRAAAGSGAAAARAERAGAGRGRVRGHHGRRAGPPRLGAGRAAARRPGRTRRQRRAARPAAAAEPGQPRRHPRPAGLPRHPGPAGRDGGAAQSRHRVRPRVPVHLRRPRARAAGGGLLPLLPRRRRRRARAESAGRHPPQRPRRGGGGAPHPSRGGDLAGARARAAGRL